MLRFEWSEPRDAARAAEWDGVLLAVVPFLYTQSVWNPLLLLRAACHRGAACAVSASFAAPGSSAAIAILSIISACCSCVE